MKDILQAVHKLVVIIINWNTMDVTKGCLSSLYIALDGIDNEVWVVDNASSDESVAMINNYFPQTRLIKNEVNVGFAKANNQALREAKGEYYLLLNSDTIVPRASISQLIDYLDTNCDVAAVGPIMLNSEGSVQYIPQSLPSLGSEIADCLLWHFPPFSKVIREVTYHSKSHWWSNTMPSQVDILSMACVIIKKKVFDKIGLLGEEYFLFSEENDFFTRMKQANFKSHLLPDISIVHLGGKSREKILNHSDEFYYKSRLLFFRKHHRNKMKLLKYLYLAFFGWSYMLSTIMKLFRRQRVNLNQLYYGKLLSIIRNKA